MSEQAGNTQGDMAGAYMRFYKVAHRQGPDGTGTTVLEEGPSLDDMIRYASAMTAQETGETLHNSPALARFSHLLIDFVLTHSDKVVSRSDVSGETTVTWLT